VFESALSITLSIRRHHSAVIPMPSPILHSVAGYALSRLPLAKQQLPGQLSSIPIAALYGIFISDMPDLDFIPQILTGLRFHRGPSHTLIAAILVSALLALIVCQIKRSSRYRELFTLTLIFYSVHLLMDFFTVGGNGMRLLWPLSEQFFISPISLFPRVDHPRGLWDAYHLIFISVELLYAMVLLGVMRARKKLNITP
jgi:inner membrane protein